MNNATARKRTQITIGLDLGDRRHTYYVLDGAGKMAREGSLGNTREQLATMARSYEKSDPADCPPEYHRLEFLLPLNTVSC